MRSLPFLDQIADRPLGVDGGGPHGLRSGDHRCRVVGRCKSRQQGGFPHDIRGEPERRTAEFVEAVQVLLAEVHVDGTEVVAELFFGAGRDQRDDRAGLLAHPRKGHLRG